MGLNNQLIFQIIHDVFVNAKLIYLNCSCKDIYVRTETEKSGKTCIN